MKCHIINFIRYFAPTGTNEKLKGRVHKDQNESWNIKKFKSHVLVKPYAWYTWHKKRGVLPSYFCSVCRYYHVSHGALDFFPHRASSFCICSIICSWQLDKFYKFVLRIIRLKKKKKTHTQLGKITLWSVVTLSDCACKFADANVNIKNWTADFAVRVASLQIHGSSKICEQIKL